VANGPSPNPDKTTQPRHLHENWIRKLPDHTIVIYTDGSKLANGAVGCGWAIYHCGDQQLHRLTEGNCHLGHRAEVYDAELHAVQEAVNILLTTTNMPRTKVFICIDNQAAINTLQLNRSNHEYARRTLQIIDTLQLLGWSICTIWCPSHCDIRGNERADTLAKRGASLTNPCHFTTTTKSWLLAQARAEFIRRWRVELPLSTPSFKFPDHLRNIDWEETRAVWRVFSNRSPSDSHPNQPKDACPCGTALNSSHHLLRECTLLSKYRTELLKATTGDIESPEFILNPKNQQPLRRFLKATGLGHTEKLCFHQPPDTTNDTMSDNSDSPEPDFGVFEP
jgi:ribonuclease HI